MPEAIESILTGGGRIRQKLLYSSRFRPRSALAPAVRSGRGPIIMTGGAIGSIIAQSTCG